MMRRCLLTLAAILFLTIPVPSPAHAAAQSDSVSQTKDCVVYVTKTGKRYHKAGCSSLRYSKIAVSRSEAIKRGYAPCKKCGGSDCEWEGD